jgi:hypothetical protein
MLRRWAGDRAALVAESALSFSSSAGEVFLQLRTAAYGCIDALLRLVLASPT